MLSLGQQGSATRQARTYSQTWKRRMGYFGIATALAVASVIPFLYGFPLHEYFEAFGKYLLFVAFGCFSMLMYSVGMTIWWWWYCLTLEKGPDDGGST